MVSKNLFFEGIDNDTDIRVKKQTRLHDASGVDLFSDGNFSSVKNIRGSKRLYSFAPKLSTKDFQVNAAWTFFPEVKFDDSGYKKVETICCIYTSENGSIYVELFFTGDPSKGSYKLVDGDKVSSELYYHVFDGVVFGEGGFDTIYFTDKLNVPKKINGRIDISSGKTFTYKQLDLVKRGVKSICRASASIPSEGNFLKVGSYQFSYRLINKDNNTKTKFSIPCNPVVVAAKDDANSVSFNAVGEEVSASIRVIVDVSDEEFSNYTHIQFGVIENVDGSKNAPEFYRLIREKEIESPGSFNYIYSHSDSDVSETSVRNFISDLTIDESAIKKVNTLWVEDNTLVLGGTEYKDLSFDNGLPSIDDATVVKDATTSRGYFRGELYRYAVSYHDEYYNWSHPEPIDFSSASGNEKAIFDFLFPERTKREDNLFPYSLEDENGFPTSLGISIMGLKNHPSWAKGVAILRAKRRKKILYQSPLIFSDIVESASSVSVYPGAGQDIGDQSGTFVPAFMFKSYEDEEEPDSWWDPLNFNGFNRWYRLFQPGRIVRAPRDRSSDPLVLQHTELTSLRSDYLNASFIFPPDYLYNNGTESYSVIESLSGKSIKYVDIFGFLSSIDNVANLDYVPTLNGSEPVQKVGDYQETRITFHLYNKDSNLRFIRLNNEYASLTSWRSAFNKFLEYNKSIRESYNITSGLETGVPVTPMDGSSLLLKRYPYTVMDYAGLKDTISNGFYPRSVKSIFMMSEKLPLPIDILSNIGDIRLLFNSSVENLIGSSKSKYRTNNADTHNFVPLTEGGLSYIAPIVNIESDLGDDRYGDRYDYNEYIFTGEYKSLTDDNVKNNTPISFYNIFGGDCYVSYHTFRTQESGIVNTISGAHTLANPGVSRDDYWNKNWGGGISVNPKSTEYTAGGQGMIVNKQEALDGASVEITCLLESENPGYFARFDYNKFEREGEAIDSSKVRTLPTYLYNFSLTRPNDNKVWIGVNPEDFRRKKFPSRIHYTLPKVYNTRFETFDTFPVGNIFDLDETYGALNALRSAFDDLYAIQERAVSVIPIQKRILESTDGNTISVRSNEFLSKERYISTSHGTDSAEKVSSSGSLLFMISSSANRAFIVNSSGVQDVSFGFVKKLREYTTEDIRVHFCPYEDVFYVYNGDRIMEYNLKNQAWMSDTKIFSSDGAVGAITSNNNFPFVIYRNNSGFVDQYKVGEDNKVLGKEIEQYIEFVVTEEDSRNKVFDVLSLTATSKVDKAQFTVFVSEADSETLFNEVDLSDVDMREGLIKTRIGKDINTRSRMRGVSCLVRILFSDKQSAISSALTEFRILNPQLQ